MDYVSLDPEASVRAQNVRATLDAFDLLPAVGRKVVEAHDLKLEDLRPEKFIRVQNWLNALKDIESKMGTLLVQQVGAKIIENADFPSQFDSVESVLLALDQIYHLNHRGDVGHYLAEQQANGAILVRCQTPYPRCFERGLVEGICRNKNLARGRRFHVQYRPGPPAGALTCTLTVSQY
jgi:hypothetical protein